MSVLTVAIELAMLGQHDSIDRALGMTQLDPVEVRLYRCATVFRCFAMRVQIKDCAHQVSFS
jgi:hypothetical protein